MSQIAPKINKICESTDESKANIENNTFDDTDKIERIKENEHDQILKGFF